MKLSLIGHNYRYAAEQIMLTMFPGERPEYPEEPVTGDRVQIALRRAETWITATCKLVRNGRMHHGTARVKATQITDKLTEDRLLQRIVKLSFYRAALKAGCPRPVWGAHTGIRPGKAMSVYLENGVSENAAVNRFIKDYDAARDRAELCLDTAKSELAVKSGLNPNDICLYIGIPFCPTRCAYCSFVSQSVEKSVKLVEPFLSALNAEIAATARITKKLGLNVISVYIGGGTPTTLTAGQLDILCGKLEREFDISRVREFTVEAGRPDTITRDKLEVLSGHGVTRISVNPQTMEDNVLEAIGRRHTARDVIAAVDIARATGFEINMDLIAGLPQDDLNGFSRSLNAAIGLEAENITVHTLALKKGSRIMLENTPLPPEHEVTAMVGMAKERLRENDYSPYYLYRQKYISGGLENTGFTKKGFINEYNICIMEELCSIISMGGGASTKLVTGTGRIERIFNPKYPLEYIEKNEKINIEKNKIEDFYNGLRNK